MNFSATQILLLLQILVGVLKSIPGVNSEVAVWIQVIENAVTQGLAAHQKAQQAVDPSQLTPEAPITTPEG